MRVGSLFAGIGGFDLGFKRAGFDVRWAVELDPAARRVLAQKFPATKLYEDVREVGSHNLERVDVVCGGFPCTDLSVAGRRAGLDGDQSGLWFEFRRILAELAPRWCVIENVPGLLSSNKGRDMGTILGSLGDLGYGWAYRVLDAQFLGLAQRRKRVFIVGCLGDRTRAAEILLEPEGVRGNPPPRRAPRADTPQLPVASTLGRPGRRRQTGPGLPGSRHQHHSRPDHRRRPRSGSEPERSAGRSDGCRRPPIDAHRV